MSKIVLGENTMVEQPIVRTYIQGQGWTWTRRWIGPKEFAFGLEQQLIAASYDIRTVEDGPNAIVEGTFGGRDDAGGAVETPIFLWEVFGNEVEKPLWNHPTIAAFSATEFGSENLLQQFIRATQDKTLRDVDPSVSESAYPVFYQAWEMFLAGVESITVYQPVLRSTATVSSRYARTAITTNVGKVFSKEKMTNTEGAPADLVPTITNQSLSFATVAGYEKKFPQVQQQAFNKYSIVTEYVGGVWPASLYTQA